MHFIVCSLLLGMFLKTKTKSETKLTVGLLKLCKAVVPNPGASTGPWVIWYQAAQKEWIIYITWVIFFF